MEARQHMPPSAEILSAISSGDRSGTDRLIESVYEDMRERAKNLLREETPRHTLQPTALVHEVFVKLVGNADVDWRGKSHFLAVGTTAMRQILVDYARRKSASKRGEGRTHVPLDDTMIVSPRRDEDVLAVNEALEKLTQIDVRRARIVELRFFGGLTNDEVATALDVSRQTVHQHWSGARAWLRRELAGSGA